MASQLASSFVALLDNPEADLILEDPHDVSQDA